MKNAGRHLALVVHPRENITHIVLGGSPERLGLAVAIGILALLVVLAIHVWATRWSHKDPRGVQVALDRIAAPVRQIALHNLSSVQNYKESDISPSHWINGAPPKPEESPEWTEMAADGFRDWRLEVNGLVEHPLSLSLDDLRAMPAQTQITKHNCVQG